ncbi:ABC transporter permease [Halomicrococcus gelatinilyticus]|uniref:ABC transporter permease n=1 Tax=Halomicrococcus gelatinilyticus TaxID=1702103 RepID=UPI002E13D8D7
MTDDPTADGATSPVGGAASEEASVRPGTFAAAESVFHRELATLRRSRAYLALAGGFLLAVVGLAVLGGGVATGYVPLVVDLLTYVEVLVPVAAFALGYRAVLDDRANGELAVLRTFPLPRASYVVGVFAARGVALAALVVAPLAVVGTLAFLQPEPAGSIYATTTGADSPVLYVRFVALTVLYGLASLAAAVAVSATARSVRSGVVVAVLAVAALSLGADLLLLGGLAQGAVGDGALATALVASPASAYRGLVMTTVVGATTSGATLVSPVAAAGSLVAWATGLLAVAVRWVW